MRRRRHHSPARSRIRCVPGDRRNAPVAAPKYCLPCVSAAARLQRAAPAPEPGASAPPPPDAPGYNTVTLQVGGARPARGLPRSARRAAPRRGGRRARRRAQAASSTRSRGSCRARRARSRARSRRLRTRRPRLSSCRTCRGWAQSACARCLRWRWTAPIRAAWRCRRRTRSTSGRSPPRCRCRACRRAARRPRRPRSPARAAWIARCSTRAATPRRARARAENPI